MVPPIGAPDRAPIGTPHPGRTDPCGARAAPAQLGSTQPSDRSTARCQPWRSAARRSAVIAGSKMRSIARVAAKPAGSDHTPTASPASAAAPIAVVSAWTGRSTGHPEEVGLELAQPVVAGGPAVDPQDVERHAESRRPSRRRRRPPGRPSRRSRRARSRPAPCRASGRRARRGHRRPSTARPGRRTPARGTPRRCR